MGGKKREKIFFHKHTYIASFKRWKKIVWKKCENTFFYKHTNIVTKKWGEKKSRKIFFQKHMYIASFIDGKNRLEKVRKHVFYKHTNIVTKKWGEKTLRKILKKDTNRVSKNCWEKFVWKKCESTFFIDT